MDIGSIVASGMQAMRQKADAHAHNVANARTPGYQRLAVRTTERPRGGVGLSVEREPSRVSTRGEGELPPASADGGSPAGNVSAADPGRVDPQEVRPEAEEGAASSSDEAVARGADADLVTDMTGMNEAARSTEMLAAVYRRHDEALGTVIDAFG